MLSNELNQMSGSTVLVTGAAGFLGRYLIAVFQAHNLLHPRPINLIAIDNYITSIPLEKNDSRKIDPNIEWIYGDAQIAAELPNHIDYIIHAAGIASPEHYQANPLETVDVAVNATKKLLEKARICKARFLYFSSSEIYGDPHPQFVPTSEDYRGNVSCRGPRACYDESKRLAETLCWIYQQYFDLKIFVIRPFNIFGPGMMPKDYRVLPNFASAIFKNEPLLVYGDGRQTRTFCYVTDAIKFMLKILVNGNNSDVYNVGNPNPEISMIDLAKKVREITNTDSKINIVGYPEKYPKDDPSRRCPNIDKYTSTFQDQPIIILDEGLKRFFSWSKLNYPLVNITQP